MLRFYFLLWFAKCLYSVFVMLKNRVFILPRTHAFPLPSSVNRSPKQSSSVQTSLIINQALQSPIIHLMHQ